MSTIIIDTITGKSTATTVTIGSTPVVSASANSLTIRGEGTAQTSIQQGLAKAWVNLDGSGTISALDSFNTSSVSDTDTGSYVFNISSVLSGADANCVQVTSIKGGGGPSGTNYTVGYTDEAANTSRFGLLTVGDGGGSGPGAVERDHVYGTLHGDLA
jgi:hypothetical protein